MRHTRRHAILIATLLAASLLAGSPTAHAQAPAAPKPAPTAKQMADRDREAKRLFISGNYREAIAVLTELYSDSGNPIYLRNIARSYQRLRDPDRAIASFEEYLLRGKDISAAEREEVKGFIRELEELKRREAEARGRTQAPAAAPATATPAPAPATGTAPAPAPGAPLAAAGPPPAVPPGSDPAASAPPMIAASDTPPASAGTWHRKAGTIALIGAGALAVGGGAMLTASWLNYNTGRDQGCGTTRDCPEREDKIKTRNLLAAGLLIGAAVAGAAGGTLLLIAPSTDHAGAPNGLAVATRGSF
jgi:hypothetical protein